MNYLWEPLNRFVTEDTLDNSEVPVPKFISSSPLINLMIMKMRMTMIMNKKMRASLRQKIRNTKLEKKMFYNKLYVVKAMEVPSSSSNNHTNKGK